MGFSPAGGIMASVRKLLAINGDNTVALADEEQIEVTDEDRKMPLAPSLTFEKYVTLQEKRVCVTIQYSGESGLKPYYLTVAKKIKASHPDILIEKRILPAILGVGPIFEIMVDGKAVVGKNNASIQALGGDKTMPDLTGGLSVFVSMSELDVAIGKARRRRRPTTMYGSKEENAVRLEMLRRRDEKDNGN